MRWETESIDPQTLRRRSLAQLAADAACNNMKLKGRNSSSARVRLTSVLASSRYLMREVSKSTRKASAREGIAMGLDMDRDTDRATVRQRDAALRSTSNLSSLLSSTRSSLRQSLCLSNRPSKFQRRDLCQARGKLRINRLPAPDVARPRSPTSTS